MYEEKRQIVMTRSVPDLPPLLQVDLVFKEGVAYFPLTQVSVMSFPNLPKVKLVNFEKAKTYPVDIGSITPRTPCYHRFNI